MFRARRSALYIALLGLGLAAGTASAVCPTGTRAVSTYINGYKCTTCVATGSEVVDVTVEPFEGPEGSEFQPAGPPLTNAVLNVNLKGTDTPTSGPLITLLPNTFVLPKTVAPSNAPKPKQLKCDEVFQDDDDADDGHVHTKKVPCELVSSGEPPNLDPPTNTLTSPEDTPMKCDRKGVCTAKVEILPTGFTCEDTGGDALDFTAKPSGADTFIIQVYIDGDTCVGEGCSVSLTTIFGCYALAGNKYSCEATTNTLVPNLCSSGSGYEGIDNNGNPTGRTYCPISERPPGDLYCSI